MIGINREKNCNFCAKYETTNLNGKERKLHTFLEFLDFWFLTSQLIVLKYIWYKKQCEFGRSKFLRATVAVAKMDIATAKQTRKQEFTQLDWTGPKIYF